MVNNIKMRSGTSPSILIVEDEPASMEMLASYLTINNYMVHKAYNSVEAKHIFATEKIDVILLDIKNSGEIWAGTYA